MSCFDKLKPIYKEFTDAEIKQVLKMLDELKQENIAIQGKRNQLLRHRISRLQDEQAIALKDKANDYFKLHNLLKPVLDPKFKGNVVEAILAPIESTTRNIDKRILTVENIGLSNKNMLQAVMLRKLRHQNLFNTAAKGDFDSLVAEMMFTEKFNSKNPLANDLAKLYKEMNDAVVGMLQESGSTIRARKGYITRQTHDLDKIRNDGVGRWVNNTVDKLDWEASFNTSNREVAKKSLSEMFNNLEEVYFGPSGISKKKRVLIFKSGKEWHDYNTQYGRGTILEGILNSIDINSRNAAIVSKFGNNPRAMKEKLINKVIQINPDAKGEIHKFSDAFEIMMGAHLKPASSPPAAIVKGMNLYNTVRLGGNFGFTAINDFNNYLMVVKRTTGSDPFTASLKFAQDAIGAITPSQQKKVAEAVAISLGDSVSELNSRLGIGRPGNLSKGIDLWMTMNMLKPVTSFFRATSGRAARRELNSILNKKGKFNLYEQNAINTAGLSELDLKNLRNIKNDDGVSFWEIDRAEKLDTGGMDLEKYRRNLKDKIGSYYNDFVNSASPTPGYKELRRAGKHLPPDSIDRMARDIAMQFKLTTLKTGSEAVTLARASSGGKAVSINSMKNLATYTVSGMLLAYGIKSFKQLSQGKEPTPMEDLTTEDYLEFISTSGVGGLPMDIMSSMANKGYGRSLGGDMSGPAWSTLEDLGNPMIQMLKGEFDEKDFRRMKRLLPAQNWWVLPTFNSYILQDLGSRSSNSR